MGALEVRRPHGPSPGGMVPLRGGRRRRARGADTRRGPPVGGCDPRSGAASVTEVTRGQRVVHGRGSRCRPRRGVPCSVGLSVAFGSHNVGRAPLACRSPPGRLWGRTVGVVAAPVWTVHLPVPATPPLSVSSASKCQVAEEVFPLPREFERDHRTRRRSVITSSPEPSRTSPEGSGTALA